MKFFHISDLHLGIKLRGRSLIEDQRHILKQIVERAAEENIDAIVIVGDIYDRSVPPAEAVELFDGFITDLLSNVDNICIMVISGNHDSQERLNIFRNILQKEQDRRDAEAGIAETDAPDGEETALEEGNVEQLVEAVLGAEAEKEAEETAEAEEIEAENADKAEETEKTEIKETA